MTVRYVGPGGSDAANGLSWANRKLTLNGVEDTPVAAADIIYVGPGTYRELLTLDVSGTAGNPITYIADTTGALTDGVGGTVRITGSDNDTTATRANCIAAPARSYRTFRGFMFELSTGIMVTLTTSPTNNIFEDCIWNGQLATTPGITISGNGGTHTVRRCIFYGMKTGAITFTHTAVFDNSANLVENCLIFCCGGNTIEIVRVGGITINNCSFIGGLGTGIRVTIAITVGQTIPVNNCLFIDCLGAFQATISGEIVENYNTIFDVSTARTNTATGANSDILPVQLDWGPLLSGFNFLGRLLGVAPYSGVRRIAGTAEAAEDLYGITRPTTSAKKTRGAIQFVDASREVTTVRTGAASMKLADAGIRWKVVPVTNVSTVFSVYTQWEADYTGTKPQMIVRQAGQSDTTVTATGSSGSWELLTTTLTPAALPPYVLVGFASLNTAASTDFDVFFDDFTVA